MSFVLWRTHFPKRAVFCPRDGLIAETRGAGSIAFFVVPRTIVWSQLDYSPELAVSFPYLTEQLKVLVAAYIGWH